MIRILHLADVHLGASFSGFGELASTRARQVLDAFTRLPDAAAEADVHAVVVAGDLFDRPQVPDEILSQVRHTFRRLMENGRPVFVVPGNHDAITLSPSPYRFELGGAHVFTAPGFGAPVSVETPAGPLHVYGLAFDRATEPAPLSTFRRSGADGVHLVLLHGSVPDSPHWGSSPNALQLPAVELARLDVDYIALGDYHAFRPPAGFAQDGVAVPACYSGSFAALNRKETGPRGWVLAELAPGEPPRVTLVPSGVPPVHDVGDVDVSSATGEVDVAEVVLARAEPGSLPVVRLVGSPDFPLDVDDVRRVLLTHFDHVWVRDDSHYFSSSRLDEIAAQDTIAGHVVRLGRERIEAARDDEEARVAAEHALRLALSALGIR